MLKDGIESSKMSLFVTKLKQKCSFMAKYVSNALLYVATFEHTAKYDNKSTFQEKVQHVRACVKIT